MNLVLVTSGLSLGGAEMQIAEIAPRLAENGWRVSVVGIGRDGPMGSRLRAARIPVTSLGFPDERLGVSPLSRVATDGARWAALAARLALAIRRNRPDVVHSHMAPANLLTRLARPALGPTVLVCTAHSIVEPPAWKNLAYRVTDALCDATTNVCRAGVEQSIRDGRVRAGRVRHVPNGVDTDRFRRSDELRDRTRRALGVEDRFVWLAVGRLSWEKDLPTMLGAFAACRHAHAPATLLVAGDGPLASETRAIADGHELGDRVRLLGVRRDTLELFCAADAYLMSSRVEGMPVALLEASACGLPAVATRVGGVHEVVLEGESGFLVPAGDPAALAAAMRRMAALPEGDRAALGRRAREHVEREYSLDRVVNRWQHLYEEILGRKRAGRGVAWAKANGS